MNGYQTRFHRPDSSRKPAIPHHISMSTGAHHTLRSHPSPQPTAMQEARDPTTKLPSLSPSPFAAPCPSPYQHHHRYGTFSPPPQQPPVAAAAYHSSPIGWGAQGVVAVPCTVQQQVFVEGLPVREPPLPFCGVGVGWALFLLGFFLAAIPWYAGAFILFFVALDHREKPGLIACTIAGIFALVPFILNGIRMHRFW